MTAAIDTQIGLKGRFKMTVSGGKRGKVVLAEFDNLILDAGLNRLGTGAIAQFAHVGTGSSTPLVSQTALDSFVASTSSSGGQADVSTYVAGPPPYINIIRTRRFAEGTATGNLTEVGIGWSATTGSLFSRALILDGLGSPTTITVLADETLDVEYTLRVYPPTVDRLGSISIGGVTYDYTMRAANISSVSSGWVNENILSGLISGVNSSFHQVYNGVIGLITGAPSGTAGSSSSVSLSAYSNNSYQRSFSVNYNLVSGNVAGGIRTATFGLGASTNVAIRFQIDFGASIPKDSTRILNLSYRVTWARRP